MKTAAAVIGANFGDEGKGLITDFLSAEFGNDALVVRYNGGAQAGHTVVDADSGNRHIFSHFGSGSFSGAATFLSRFFVCNPLLFANEQALLSNKLKLPKVFVDGAAPITTPYDMMINQIVEDFRGSDRHGSCGLGFGETIERQQFAPYRLIYSDLFNKNDLKEKLKLIRKEWLPKRLAVLGVDKMPEQWESRVYGDGVLDKFIDDVALFLQSTENAANEFLKDTQKKIVFEGAQGLLLDQDRGYFPHVTRSNTGIKNICLLAEEAGIADLEVNYITRAYMTRHGAGPLKYELENMPYSGIEDKTNITNDYQGSLRFAWLDADILAKAIADDLSDNNGAFNLKHGLAVTCLDQVDDEVSFVNNGELLAADKEGLLQNLRAKTNSAFMRTSFSPSRSNISLF